MGRRLLLVFAALLAVAALSCSQDEEVSQTEQAVSAATDYTPLVSSAVQVRSGPLRDRVYSSGVIRGQREVVIRTRTGGVIEAINFELGEKVVTNQVLLSIEDRIASLTVSQLRQQYESAKSDLSSSQALYERGAISFIQLQQARAALDGLEAQLQQAEDALANTRVKTPMAGWVAEKSTGLVEGDLIASGQEIGRVIDLNDLRITLPLGQDQLFLVDTGYRAQIDIRTPSGAITTNGSVTAVSAGSDAETGSWKALVDFRNPRPSVVRAGLSAEVTIFNEDAPVYTLVPTSSLVRRDGRNYVFRVEDQKAEMTEVVLLDQYGNDAAVVSMDPAVELLDYRVLVSGLTRVRDGDETVVDPYDR